MRAIGLLCLMFPHAGQLSALETDWLTLFRKLVSSDRSVSDAARTEAFELVPKLESASPESLRSTLPEILGAFEEKDDKIRLQASALLYALALRRGDGSEVLASVVPVWLSQFADKHVPIRQNAVAALVNLRPEVPGSAVTALVAAAADRDSATAGAAMFGLVRLAGSSEAARASVDRLLSSGSADVKKTIIKSIGFAQADYPALVERLGGMLRADDESIVLEAITAVRRLGSKAASLRSDLLRLCAAGPASNVCIASRAAADRLSKVSV